MATSTSPAGAAPAAGVAPRDTEQHGYVFGPRDTAGLLLGLRGAQLAAVVAGLAALVAGLSAGPTGALAGLAAAALAAAVAFVPLAGRTGEQWAPVVAGHAAQRLTGQHTWRRPLRRGGPGGDTSLPGLLAGLRIVAVPVPGGAEVGVLVDPARGRWTAVVAVAGRTFALLESGEQDRRVQAWGRLLAELARDGSPVAAVQWVERTVPDRGDALARFWAARGGHGTEATAASYRALLAGAGPVTQRHETYLAVAVDARLGRRAIRAAGGGDTGATAVLLREIAAIQERLVSAQLDVHGWLPPRGLAQVLRTAFEPGAQPALDARHGATEGPGPGLHPDVAGPMATTTSWSSYRSDDAWHATYWVHEWPRLEVGADFLAPLLLHTPGLRTVAVHAEPVDARTAARAVAAARTAALANQALRERVGQVTTRREEAEADDVTRREAELVAGHAEYRFTAFVTVTAATPEALEEACAALDHAAHASYLEVRRMYGEQDQAFTYTLPIARSPR